MPQTLKILAQQAMDLVLRSYRVQTDFFDIDDYSKLFSEDGYCFATNQFYDKFIVPNKEASWKITEEELTKYMIGISEEIDRMNNEK